MSKSKGSRYERKLVDALQAQGYFARRAGSSGSATEAESYDVIAAKDGDIYVIELKFTSSTSVYIDHEKVHGTNTEDGPRGLTWIADQFGATPLLVARFSGDTTFYAMTPSQAGPPTDGGRYAISESEKSDAMVLASG